MTYGFTYGASVLSPQGTCTCGEDTGSICHNAAIGLLTLACAHEHLHTCRLCKGCLVAIRQPPGIVCHRCRDCGEPHECVMREARWEPSP